MMTIVTMITGFMYLVLVLHEHMKSNSPLTTTPTSFIFIHRFVPPYSRPFPSDWWIIRLQPRLAARGSAMTSNAALRDPRQTVQVRVKRAPFSRTDRGHHRGPKLATLWGAGSALLTRLLTSPPASPSLILSPYKHAD